MRPDRIVALFVLAFSVGYGYLAWTYPLLPFERFLAFRPNTMPIGLSGLGVFFSLAVLIAPGGGPTGLSGEADGWRALDWRRFAGIVVAMVLYALALRPLGYLASTTAFIVAGAIILGERRVFVLLAIALAAAGSTWWLVDRVLGVFLKPWPLG